MKKMILGLVAVSCMFMFANTSQAAYAWYVCSVDRIGVTGVDDNVFKVTGCDVAAGSGKWITVSLQKDTSMATLLTARSLGAKVKVQADMADASYYKPLQSLFLMEPRS